MGHNSKLPSLLMNTDKRLNRVSIKKYNIISITKSLNPTEAHGFDNISIHMIQLYGDSIVLTLVQIFKSSLSESVFPDTWKMAYITPLHKNESK